MNEINGMKLTSPITNRILSINGYESTKEAMSKIQVANDIAWISITDIDEPFVYLLGMPMNINFFHAQFPDGSIKPAVNILNSLVEFILANDNKLFVINCMAGISRSTAIARAIHCILDHNGNSAEYFMDNQVSRTLETYFYDNGKIPNSVLYESILLHYNQFFNK